ncbi:M18 family aminopeptidase [Halomonas sp. GXIMD04776]|uniref:M18 family aminopeptidase n=1 Tax=Halomonas sp. GXIMD04776 TaxID=3415605 RepID=UPI003C9F8B2B
MSLDPIVKRLLRFLEHSPTPWHATQNMLERLEQAGFRRLHETQAWELKAGERVVVTRNDSSLIALQLPHDPLSALRMIGAHTDSPGLRLKPNAALNAGDWLQLGVEVYGGALLAPWFDRDLALAGRVHVRHGDGRLQSLLLDTKHAVAMVPSLAIHLDRDVNNGRPINPQTQMAPVLCQGSGKSEAFETLLRTWLEEQHELKQADILSFELCFYDTQPPAVVGVNADLIASARLDNLLSCFIGMEALLESDGTQGAVLVANDHEEVGSASTSGAQGPFLLDVLRRVVEQLGDSSEQEWSRLIQSSCMISCDNAHALHPNFSDKHDAAHGPSLNGGPVIKVNANQRYATNSVTAALFRDVCRDAEVPVQTFVTRADMGCGSTIGPITATELGVPTLDVGVAQWAMHSIRETAGSKDAGHLIRALTTFLNRRQLTWD